VKMRDTQGTEFSRFLPLAIDEGESQAVGGLCVSFVEEVRECAVPTRSSFLLGTAFSDVSARTESEMETVIVPDDGSVILNGPRAKVRNYSTIAMNFMVQLWSSNSSSVL